MTRSKVSDDDRPSEGLRVDKWLWHARFFKTRARAAETVSAGRVRLNGTPIRKPSTTVRAGDALTFPMGHQIRVVRVLGFAARRGPASEAVGLYEDVTPQAEKPSLLSAGGERPTKKSRRQLDQTRGSRLE